MSIILTACTIQFFTGNASRDADPLEVQIKNAAEQSIAVSLLTITDSFAVNSASKVYHLEVIPNTLKSSVDSSNVWLSILPESKVWEFNFALDATFSDGSMLCCSSFDQKYTTNTTVPNVNGRSYPFRRTTFDLVGAELTSAAIQFHSNASGKQANTHLLVIVEDQNGYVAALTLMDEKFGAFAANSTHSPIKLHLRKKSTKGSLPKGRLIVCITPVAAETWNLDYTLRLGFADGNDIVSEKKTITLNNTNHPFIENIIG